MKCDAGAISTGECGIEGIKGLEGIKELSKPIVFDEKGFCEERSDAAICLIKSGCQIKGQ